MYFVLRFASGRSEMLAPRSSGVGKMDKKSLAETINASYRTFGGNEAEAVFRMVLYGTGCLRRRGAGYPAAGERFFADIASLQLLQFREVHTQTFLAKLTAELHLDELGILLHLAFENDALAKLIVPHPVARLELLSLRLSRYRWRWRRFGR